MPLEKAQDAHKYNIIEEVAAGSFGVVFKIKRLSDNRTMVMKRIPLENLDREQRHEAAKELSLISELHHPYIVAQRDAFLFDENDLCLVMDYYDGGDLDYLLARQRDKDEYFDFEQVMLWFVQMLLALDYLHFYGIVHRDVKTHNFFLDQTSNTIAVGDFGISEKIDFNSPKKDAGGFAVGTAALSSSLLATAEKSQRRGGKDTRHHHTVGHPHGGLPPAANNLEGFEDLHHANISGSAKHLSETDMAFLNPSLGSAVHGRASESPPRMVRSPIKIAVKGTPLYMPPEAVQGLPYGPKSDVWSLGCILYELLSLRHPFDSTDIGGLIMRIMLGDRGPLPTHYSPAVSELINATLTLESAKRPSCDELLHTPLVSAYVRRLLELRARARSRDAGSVRSSSANPKYPFKKATTGLQEAQVEEDALQSQLRRIYGSLGTDSILPNEGPHATMSYLECGKQVKKPLNPPSYDCEQARRERRPASALVQLASSSSAFTTDAPNNLDNSIPRDFLRCNTFPSLELSSGPGLVAAPPAGTRQRTLSDIAEDDVGHGAANTDDDDSPNSARPGSHDAEHRRLLSLSKSSTRSFSVDHTSVDDFRNQPLSVLAAEVLRARALLQRALFERQRRRDAARLLLEVGPHLAATMPQTFKGVATSASDPAVTGTASSLLRRATGEGWQRAAAPTCSSGVTPGLGCPGLGQPASTNARGVPPATHAHAAANAKLQLYLDRRAALVRLILEELPAMTLSRVYGYYYEHNIFVRDPGVVLSLVPERKRWWVLPFIEDLVVLDKFLEQGTNNDDSRTCTARTVSSERASF